MTESECLAKMKAPGDVRSSKRKWPGTKLTILDMLTPRLAYCICDCGNKRKVQMTNLERGLIKTCGAKGCSGSMHSRHHGMTGSPEWVAWQSMKSRCDKKTDKAYHNYGGRGITYCSQWKSFTVFFRDVGKRPSPRHTLDRVNNLGNYEPGNVRWATGIVQSNNKRNNVFLEYKGERFTIAQWARKLGIGLTTLFERLRMGWSIERVLTTPVGKQGKKNYDRI